METVHFKVMRGDGGTWEARAFCFDIVVVAWSQKELFNNIELACDVHFSGRKITIVCIG